MQNCGSCCTFYHTWRKVYKIFSGKAGGDINTRGQFHQRAYMKLLHVQMPLNFYFINISMLNFIYYFELKVHPTFTLYAICQKSRINLLKQKLLIKWWWNWFKVCNANIPNCRSNCFSSSLQCWHATSRTWRHNTALTQYILQA